MGPCLDRSCNGKARSGLLDNHRKKRIPFSCCSGFYPVVAADKNQIDHFFRKLVFLFFGASHLNKQAMYLWETMSVRSFIENCGPFFVEQKQKAKNGRIVTKMVPFDLHKKLEIKDNKVLGYDISARMSAEK